MAAAAVTEMEEMVKKRLDAEMEAMALEDRRSRQVFTYVAVLDRGTFDLARGRDARDRGVHSLPRMAAVISFYKLTSPKLLKGGTSKLGKLCNQSTLPCGVRRAIVGMSFISRTARGARGEITS